MIILIGLILLQAAILLGLGLYGTGRILATAPGPDMESPLPATVIIPVTGDSPVVRKALLSLLALSPKPLRTVLAVRDDTDPAWPLCRQLAADRDDVRVVSGRSTEAASRKIANQLAGIAAAHPDSRVYVFFDAGHVAPADMAARLLEPVLLGRTVVSSGYHRVQAGSSTGDLLHAVSVTFLHVMQTMPVVTQPWGGAMAIDVRAFDTLQVARLWRTNVVDDCSLAALLQRKGLRTTIVPGADTVTSSREVSVAWWWEWWVRQLQYMRYCFPGTWHLAALGLSMASLTTLAGLCCLVIRPGWGLMYGLMLTVAALVFRRGLIGQTKPWRFTAAFAGFLLLALPACLVTYLRRAITWRGVRYDVGPGGTVTTTASMTEDP